jgi:hypothetical protein
MTRIGLIIIAFTGWIASGSSLFPDTAHAQQVCRWQMGGNWTLYQRNGFRLPMNMTQNRDAFSGTTFGGRILGRGDVTGYIWPNNYISLEIRWQSGNRGHYDGWVRPYWSGSTQTLVLTGDMFDYADVMTRVQWWKGTPMFYRCTPT